jgi:hypothetical protein
MPGLTIREILGLVNTGSVLLTLNHMHEVYAEKYRALRSAL